MRYWYDCEFLEDGKTIAPISIGIVAEDGREYYAVNNDAPFDRVRVHAWLMANVVPNLGPLSQWLPLATIREEVRHFFLGRNEHVELWGYYSSYDHILLSQLFGRMIDRPKGLPMWTNDVQQVAYELGLEASLPAQPGDLHNALADARWTRDAWVYLMEQKGAIRRAPEPRPGIPASLMTGC